GALSLGTRYACKQQRLGNRVSSCAEDGALNAPSPSDNKGDDHQPHVGYGGEGKQAFEIPLSQCKQRAACGRYGSNCQPRQSRTEQLRRNGAERDYLCEGCDVDDRYYEPCHNCGRRFSEQRQPEPKRKQTQLGDDAGK